MPLLDSHRDVERGEPGDFCWWPETNLGDDNAEACLFIRLPNEKAVVALKVSTIKQAPGVWWWNGNRERPTVRPSIMQLDRHGNELWHGWLTDGELTPC